jgi:hypothetical protein
MFTLCKCLDKQVEKETKEQANQAGQKDSKTSQDQDPGSGLESVTAKVTSVTDDHEKMENEIKDGKEEEEKGVTLKDVRKPAGLNDAQSTLSLTLQRARSRAYSPSLSSDVYCCLTIVCNLCVYETYFLGNSGPFFDGENSEETTCTADFSSVASDLDSMLRRLHDTFSAS